jgi:hypothetical protein
MSDIRPFEKSKLEKLLRMQAGTVLEFSNRSFQEFVYDSVKINIDDKKYILDPALTSKANRLRAFWRLEPDYVVAKLLDDLFKEWKHSKDSLSYEEVELLTFCTQVSDRLKQGSPIENVDAILANGEEVDFTRLADLLKEAINRGEYAESLDRLHTFMVKYTRQLCKNREIELDIKDPLHSAYGKYIKLLKASNLLHSEMTEYILNAHIKILDRFNLVRNNQSYAHDNNILNEQESLLILSNITSLIKYIDYIEQVIFSTKPPVEDTNEW